MNLKERLLRYAIRKHLYYPGFYRIMSIIWDEHRQTYYDDNVFTRYEHLKEMLDNFKKQDLDNARKLYPVPPSVTEGEEPRYVRG